MALGGTNLSHVSLSPKTALVVYERSGDNTYTNEEDDEVEIESGLPRFYVESHSVHLADDGKFRIGEGSPITYDSVGMLAHAFSKQATEMTPVKGILPKNVLAVNQSPGKLDMLWYDTPQLRTLLYNGGVVSFLAPGMLYELTSGVLNVFATNAKGRPTNKTMLYNLNWTNMSGGQVCMGSTDFKRYSYTFRLQVEEWTRAFWMSEFSMGKGCQAVKLLHELEKSKEPFPLKTARKLRTFGQYTASY